MKTYVLRRLQQPLIKKVTNPISIYFHYECYKNVLATAHHNTTFSIEENINLISIVKKSSTVDEHIKNIM